MFFLFVLPVRGAVGCPGCTVRREWAANRGPSVSACSWALSGGGERAGQVTLALVSNRRVCLHTWLLKCLQPWGTRLKPVCK